MERIPIAGPWITEHEIRYVADAAAHGWYQQANEYVDRFERAMAEYLAVPYAIALPSCTSAIHLALAALEIGPGDEVIVPEVTWIASAAPLTYVGAAPRWVDIDERHWCLSLASAERAITPRTKAILAVDLYGNVPDWSGLRALADRHGLPILEDAAEAIGTHVGETAAGSFGDVGVFSFHGSKTITTGEGGMLVTHSRELYERVLVLRDHGRRPTDRSFFNGEVAYKYKMSNLQAAMGLAQLERIDEILARKRAIMEWYREALANESRLTLNPDLPGVTNSYWMVTAILDARVGLYKEDLLPRLSARGVDARPFFYPLSALPAYANTDAARRGARENSTAYRLSPFGVNLPSALNLTRVQVARVAAVLREILDEAESLPVREAA